MSKRTTYDSGMVLLAAADETTWWLGEFTLGRRAAVAHIMPCHRRHGQTWTLRAWDGGDPDDPNDPPLRFATGYWTRSRSRLQANLSRLAQDWCERGVAWCEERTANGLPRRGVAEGGSDVR